MVSVHVLNGHILLAPTVTKIRRKCKAIYQYFDFCLIFVYRSNDSLRFKNALGYNIKKEQDFITWV
jgi:hypothetical protein